MKDEQAIYVDGMCANFVDKILASASKRGLQSFWVLKQCQSRTSGRQYQQRTIAAVVDGKVTLTARCNRKGAVSWDRVQEYYQPFYEIQEQVEVGN